MDDESKAGRGPMSRNTAIVAGVVLLIVVVAWLKEAGKEDLLQPIGPLPRLVELGGGTCESCRKMKPIIAELQKAYAGKVQVESIHVVDQAKRARPYKWHVIPCLVFLDAEGRELWRYEGFLSKADIEAKFKELGMQ